VSWVIDNHKIENEDLMVEGTSEEVKEVNSERA